MSRKPGNEGSDPRLSRVLGTTLFVSAFLLFLCQPMVGKMALPYLGGAASVWTTCVLFFQATLLAGYVYAHLLGRLRNVRQQILIHAFVFLLALAFLPIGLDGASLQFFSGRPSITLLALLLGSVGVPFFVVSTTAPLLQSWLARTKDISAQDPYFLYAASNTGSLLALLAYPFLLEPRMGVAAQSRLWSAGYGLLLAFLALSAALVWRLPARKAGVSPDVANRPSVKEKFFWAAAAFVPSGLMLAVTSHVAANLASAPFLWIVPLAIYLLTFILAFAPRFQVSSARISRLIPIVLLAMFPLVAAGVVAPPGLNWILIGAHLLVLYCGALLCHTALAERRPEPRHLTEFYFWIAVGGVFGGVFTAMIAPAVFNTVLEYPLIVALVPFFRSGNAEKNNLLSPALFGIAILLMWAGFRATGLDSNTEVLGLVHTAIIFVCYKLRSRIRSFALSFAVLIAAYALILPGYIEGGTTVYTSRNFFGVKKVLDDSNTRLRKLLHGDTIHGIESTDPARTGRPLSYYYDPGGAVSEVIDMMRGRREIGRFAVIGLGSGTMAAYADQSRHMTFFEIDPSVETIARRFFTFLPQCGENCEVVLGDGRLEVAKMADGTFDLLMLDAFSSDSIPGHLVSREAVRLYMSKIATDGVLLFHTSNRFLNVDRLVGALVTDAGLVAYSRFDEAGDLREKGKSNSSHVVAARRIEDLRPISTNRSWKRVTPPGDFTAWTDDYSSLLGLVRWH